jgi:integrase
LSIHTRRLATGRTLYEIKLRTPTGRQYSKSFRTRREAEAYQVKEKASQLTGAWVDPRAGELTIEEYTRDWMYQRVALRPRTVDLYRYLLDHHILPGLGHHQLRAVSPAMVRAWHADLGRKTTIGPSTRAKAYRLLRTMMTTAVDDELIVKNPCVVKGASVERHDERPVATIAQVAALAGHVDPRYRAMILLACWCGLRYGELAGLTRADIDLATETVTISRQLQETDNGVISWGPPKTDAGKRSVAVPPHLLPLLADHLRAIGPGADQLLFPAPEGGPLRNSNFNRRIWRPALDAVGLVGFHFHDLRHTGNTLAAQTGASTKELMARMGHASPRAALIYQHATKERDKAVARALSDLAAQAAGTPDNPAEEARTTPDVSEQCSIKVRSSPPEASNILPFRRKVLVRAVETMGLEPTTPCLQITGWRVSERPQAFSPDNLDAHALPQSARVATAVATATRRVFEVSVESVGYSGPKLGSTPSGRGTSKVLRMNEINE